MGLAHWIIFGLVGLLATLILHVSAHLLAGEVEHWLPRLTGWGVKLAARGLPESYRDRLSEEWQGHLWESRGGELTKLLIALGFVWAGLKVKHADRWRTSQAKGAAVGHLVSIQLFELFLYRLLLRKLRPNLRDELRKVFRQRVLALVTVRTTIHPKALADEAERIATEISAQAVAALGHLQADLRDKKKEMAAGRLVQPVVVAQAKLVPTDLHPFVDRVLAEIGCEPAKGRSLGEIPKVASADEAALIYGVWVPDGTHSALSEPGESDT